jgi:hypothetical protein
MEAGNGQTRRTALAARPATTSAPARRPGRFTLSVTVYTPIMEDNRNGIIRPRDPKVIGMTTTHMPIPPADVIRRLLQLGFRDARTVADMTYAGGCFWREPLPPGIVLTTSSIDPAAETDLHHDFTATGLPDGAYDVVIIDPPHNQHTGQASFMRARYGSATRELIEDGVRESWRVGRLGIIVKVQDQNHGSRYVEESEWVRHGVLRADGTPMPVYIKLEQLGRPTLGHGRRKLHQRVPYRSASTYLVFRKDGPEHHDWDAEYLRQERARCVVCNALLLDRRRQTTTCSPACRQKAYRRRAATV